jgi:hypothetical protein
MWNTFERGVRRDELLIEHPAMVAFHRGHNLRVLGCHRAKVVARFNHLFAQLHAVVKPEFGAPQIFTRATPNRSEAATRLLHFFGRFNRPSGRPAAYAPCAYRNEHRARARHRRALRKWKAE